MLGSSLIVLCKDREIWYNIICFGVHFILSLCSFSNTISDELFMRQLLSVFADIDNRLCFIWALISGVRQADALELCEYGSRTKPSSMILLFFTCFDTKSCFRVYAQNEH